MHQEDSGKILTTCLNADAIEIKIGQGAKIGHGGLLPGSKVTELVAENSGIPSL